MVPSGRGEGGGGRGGRADLAPSLHTTMPAPTFTEIRKTVDNYSFSLVHINLMSIIQLSPYFVNFTRKFNSLTQYTFICNLFNPRIHQLRMMDDGRSMAQSSFALEGLGH